MASEDELYTICLDLLLSTLTGNIADMLLVDFNTAKKVYLRLTELFGERN